MSIPLQPRQWSPVDKDAESHPSMLGSIRDVPLTHIDFSQHYVTDEKVSAIAKAIKAGKQMAAPVGAMVRGRVVIKDGHNRAAAHAVAGKRTMKVRVF